MDTSTTSPGRSCLSLKRKIELIKAFESASPKKTKTQIAKEFGIRPGTVIGILNNKEKLQEAFYKGDVDKSVKRFRKSVHEDIENALHTWFKCACESNLGVNGPMLISKAEEIAFQLGKTDWKCSEGWLYRFRKRRGIVFNSSTGSMQLPSVDANQTEVWLVDAVRPTLSGYDPKNVFCVGECGLFWRLLPDRSVLFESEKCHGGQHSKERLSIMLCANMAGSEKWPLLSVGKFVNPRSFEGIRKLPVLYEPNDNAWTTTDLFKHWLRSFDSAMEAQNRKVLLVLGSSNVQQRVDNLSATELLFMPANAQAQHQPTQAMIKNLKVNYRYLLLSKLVQHLDLGLRLEDFRITLLDALAMLKSAWEKVAQATITSSFYMAGFGIGKDIADTAPILAYGASVDVSQTETLDPLLAKLYTFGQVSGADYVAVDDNLATTSLTPSEFPPPLPMSQGTGSDLDDCGEGEPSVSQLDALAAISKVGLHLMQAAYDDAVISRFQEFKKVFVDHMVRTYAKQKQDPV